MKKYLVISVILVAAFALSACGAGSDANTTIDVTFTDFHFEPESFVIAAGQEITMNATNNGAVEHEFVIMNYGQTIGEDFGDEDEDNIFWEIEVLAGESDTVTFTAPTEPGEYQIVCGIEGHFLAGMVGTLTVK